MPGSGTRAAVGSSSLMLLSFRLGRLLDRRHVAGQRRAAHVTDLVAVVEAAGAVHHLAVVPHDDVARSPDVRIHEVGLRRMFRQIAQEHAGFRDGPALDRPGMRGQEQRFAASHGMDAHKALAYWFDIRTLLFSQCGARYFSDLMRY